MLAVFLFTERRHPDGTDCCKQSNPTRLIFELNVIERDLNAYAFSAVKMTAFRLAFFLLN